MKKVLIISPHFPPINAADMHRIRQSLSYYKENNWLAEVVVVDPEFVEGFQDKLLLETLPSDIKIHKVKALNAGLTRKFGLGSIAYRSMYYYWKVVNSILRNSNYDLIFFSTTAFPITILGRVWKRKFNIPYIIDMQDPWRPDHYLTLPKNQRPPKFWLSYKLDKWLEEYAMKNVDGLLSVSQTYIDVLKNRYSLHNIPSSVIPFAAFKKDIEVALESKISNKFFSKSSNIKNIVYIGRGGDDMVLANTIFLEAIKKGSELYDDFKSIKLYFIGTSYDPSGNGESTVLPIAKSLGIDTQLIEITQRISYFESIKVLSDADLLFVPGSDNIGYTASKIYPYVWLNKPIITLFHSSSSVNNFMIECNAGMSLQFDTTDRVENVNNIIQYIHDSFKGFNSNVNWDNFEKYTAKYQVKKQTELFESVAK